jgi:hypothetical protein
LLLLLLLLLLPLLLPLLLSPLLPLPLPRPPPPPPPLLLLLSQAFDELVGLLASAAVDTSLLVKTCTLNQQEECWPANP